MSTYIYQYNAHVERFKDSVELLAESRVNDSTLPNNCFRSLQWSPDGTSLATSSEDNGLRIHAFSCDSKKLSLHQTISHSETLTTYSWYPYMNQTQPETCCIATGTRDQPIRLRDTNTGIVRASYVAYDACEVLMTASAVEFSQNGLGIYAGYKSYLARFDIHRPGLPVDMSPTSPSKRSRDGTRGVVSCIEPDNTNGLVACATFSGHICLRSQSNLTDVQMSWQLPVEYGGKGGVDCLGWAPNSHVLWASSRGRRRHIVAWDTRDMRGPLDVISKQVTTGERVSQQRMQFSFDQSGRYLVTGEIDGRVAFHDLWALDTDKSTVWIEGHRDVVAGVGAHPFYPLLATASGQRHFRDEDGNVIGEPDSSLKVWSVPALYTAYE